MSDKEKKEVITEETVIEQTDEGVAVEEVIEKSEYADFDDLAEAQLEQENRDKKTEEDKLLPPDENALLEVRHLKKYFVLKKTITGKPLSTLKAVDDVSIKINPGETSEDGLFTLDALRCIGACGITPAVSINGTVYPKMTVDAVPAVM